MRTGAEVRCRIRVLIRRGEHEPYYVDYGTVRPGKAEKVLRQAIAETAANFCRGRYDCDIRDYPRGTVITSGPLKAVAFKEWSR